MKIEFTKKQAEKLGDVLDDHWDEGPTHAGWGSDELCELRAIVWAAIHKHKQPALPNILP